MNFRMLVILTFYIFIYSCELNTWSKYKIAKQDTWINNDYSGTTIDIKKGDLCRFYSIGSGTHMSEVKCKSGIKGQIEEYLINKYFIDQ